MAGWTNISIYAGVMARILSAGMLPTAFGQTAQNITQFWVVTDLGNVYPIIGPPPERPPGFDSAPFLNMEPLDSMIAVAAGRTSTTGPTIHFDEAGTVNPLPSYDKTRTYMRADIISEWGGASRYLYANMPVGEIARHGVVPYMATARVGPHPSIDILGSCNQIGGTKCVDNFRNSTLSIANTTQYGHVLDLPVDGRTIIHMRLPNNTSTLEVMFTCPECRDVSHATYVEPLRSFETLGYRHTSSWAVTPAVPYVFRAGNLTGLAWDSTYESHSALPNARSDYIGYWQDGGGCTPNLAIAGNSIVGYCTGGGAGPLQTGAVQSRAWQPLYPGWNAIYGAEQNSAIVVTSPGADAKLQVRLSGATECCHAFDGSIYNRSNKPAVIHNADRHLLIIPGRGEIPADHPVLREMQTVRNEINQMTNTTTRWIAHSDTGDPIYHGFLYDSTSSDWMPYKVRFVDSNRTDFRWTPSTASFDPFESHFYGFNYSPAEKFSLLGASDRSNLMSSEIYDIRNHKMLRTDIGLFKFWDGTHLPMPYIEPWMAIEKNPFWELYGVELPRDGFVIVDMYATIPIVKPTRISGTYLSSLPCGPTESTVTVGDLRGAVLEAYGSGGYDLNMLGVLLFAPNTTGGIEHNMLMQNAYKASRTYLDYLDGDYVAGDSIHVPILGNRPYLCTIIAPNILESQYLLYGLPFGSSYLSLGGGEGVAPLDRGFNVGSAGTYVYRGGVQSPRDGVLSLDITTSIGVSVAALGMGDGTGWTGNITKWWNGTLTATGEVWVGQSVTSLGSWTVDAYDVQQEEYAKYNDRCYGRFVTIPDDSGYTVRTIAVPAHQGEHIPVEVRLSIQSVAGTFTPLCTSTEFESVVAQFIFRTFSIDVR